MRAFRGAASTLRALSPDDLRSRARQGRLRDLPGIGQVTETVVLEALDGQTPAYLAKLDEEVGESVAVNDELGTAIRAALKGDCHTHSDWSDGGSSIDDMATAAAALGHEYIALTDHSPRLTVARGLTAERLREQLSVVAALNEWLAPFEILTGIEVDILDDGSLDQEDELLGGLDVVVASVHSKLRMEPDAMTRRMIAAVSNPHTDVLGHCTGRLMTARARPESTFDADAVFAACVEHGTAVEVNCRPERLDPPIRLLRKAVEAGCRFALNTDAHAPGQLEWQPNGCIRAAQCEVPVDRIVNTWPAAKLREWTASRA